MREYKAALIEGATQLLGKGLDKNPATTAVVIDEVEADIWGVAGETPAVRRARRLKGGRPGHTHDPV